MSYASSPAASELTCELDEPSRKASLKISVVGVTPEQQLFIKEAVSHQFDLKFISIVSLKSLVRSGTLPLQGLLFFLVPAERRNALHQIEIMKSIMDQQPGLNMIPLIFNKLQRDNMRKSLVSHFPVYVPINFTSKTDGDLSAEMHAHSLAQFSQTIEALAGSTVDSETTVTQLRELNGQMQIEVAQLLKQNLRLERQLATAVGKVWTEKHDAGNFIQ